MDEHKDEKSFQEHDNFREDVLKVVMRLSDIIMTIMEKDFDNGNFDVRESLNQVGFAVKEMNIEEKTQANSIRTFEESKGNIYNKKDITDRKSTRLNSSHASISYAVFCSKKKT